MSNLVVAICNWKACWSCIKPKRCQKESPKGEFMVGWFISQWPEQQNFSNLVCSIYFFVVYSHFDTNDVCLFWKFPFFENFISKKYWNCTSFDLMTVCSESSWLREGAGKEYTNGMVPYLLLQKDGLLWMWCHKIGVYKLLHWLADFD